MGLKRLSLAALMLPVFACAQPTEVAVESEGDKTLYAVGQGLATQFALKGLFTAEELKLVIRGFEDAILGREEAVSIDDYMTQMNDLVQDRRATKNAADGDAFRAREEVRDGVQKTTSGLLYEEIQAGSGAQPKRTNTVTVHYTGTLVNGQVFDSSRNRSEPTTFALDAVIPGWTEGLQMMRVGGKARLVISPELGYGEDGFRNVIPPNATLIFELELLEIK